MIDCIGPHREWTRTVLISRHEDLYMDTTVHLAWIAHGPEKRKGWTVWWQGDQLIEVNTPTAGIERMTEGHIDRFEMVRDIVNRSL